MSSRRYTVAFLAGDGVGPELTAEASRALASVSRSHGFAVDDLHLPFGGEALVRFGNRLPLATQRDLARADAVLVAAPGEPAFQVVKNAIDPVVSVTRVAHGDSSTLVIGPSEREYEHVAVRAAFLLAARRRARLTSVGGSEEWSELVAAEAAADARGIAVHHRTFGEALNAFSSGEHLDVVVADTYLHVALADALAVLGGSADAVARGWLPESGAGLFAPAEVLDPTVAGYGAVDPASMLLAVSHLLAAGLREHAAATTLERAVAAAAAAGYGPGAAKASALAATTRTFTDAVIARLSENRTDVELLREIKNDEVTP
jgi:3-isopropylmalate dehydrogenase